MLQLITPPSTPVLINYLGTKKVGILQNNHKYGLFQCQCGNTFEAYLSGVKSGNTKSCGCYNIQRIQERNFKHGYRRTRMYTAWSNMKARCYNEKSDHFIDYGGRGITVCDEWKNNFISFYEWAIQNGYDKNLEIDRRNVNGNYEPSNCRFVTRSINTQNTRLLFATNKSGYRGVSFHKQHQKWQAYITANNKRKYLGIFKDIIEAAKAYNKYVVDNGLEHPLNIING